MKARAPECRRPVRAAGGQALGRYWPGLSAGRRRRSVVPGSPLDSETARSAAGLRAPKPGPAWSHPGSRRRSPGPRRPSDSTRPAGCRNWVCHRHPRCRQKERVSLRRIAAPRSSGSANAPGWSHDGLGEVVVAHGRGLRGARPSTGLKLRGGGRGGRLVPRVQVGRAVAGDCGYPGVGEQRKRTGSQGSAGYRRTGCHCGWAARGGKRAAVGVGGPPQSAGAAGPRGPRPRPGWLEAQGRGAPEGVRAEGG